ncbi:coiled-coil domain-containing protein 87 [Calonectris borealis]|uniref:coiled-coil domain-containing protein 87 n=1 Tax=Calonectris borealis TaxID=1323832 RepID=UPI003F4C54A5
MATARPGTPGATGTPRPEPPVTESCAGTAGLRRGRLLPEQSRGRRLPEEPGVSLAPRCLSPVMPVPHGEPLAPEIPPDALAVMADLRRLTRRAAGEDRREASAGGRLPPLLAVLTRRTEDDARLRQLQRLRLPATPRRGAPTHPQLPSPRLLLRPSTAGPRVPPGRAFAERVALQPHPALCHDAWGDPEPEPLGVQELYRELGRTLPAERLRFHHEPLVEPAATAADLLPTGERGPQNAGEPPRRRDARHGPRQTARLFDDYLQYVAATGSDFLCAIFHLRGSDDDEEEQAGAPQPRQEPSPPPAEPYEKGLWKPVLPGPVPAGLERLQRRLCRLWAALGVPGWERLDMAVKYGAGGTLAQLPAALEAWEAAAGDILRRELLLARLERLEERGSDPGRFFRRGPVTAAQRAGEARARDRLRAALGRCEARLSAALRHLRDGFGDAVTFRGRPYAEKMRRDAVEMLYWLQQRRRAGVLQAALEGQPRRHPPGPARAETSGRQ